MRTILAIGFFVFCINVFAQVSKPPTGLTVELLRAPDKAFVSDSIPEFGWIIPQENIMQTAYRILVSSSVKNIENNFGDIWDSGKRMGNISINIPHEGGKLKPLSEYYWKVKVWDKSGSESSYSEYQRFRTGNFEKNREWAGQSEWLENSDGDWFAEDRQRADIVELKPVSFVKTAKSAWFADFGKAAFGTLRLTITSPSEGEKVRVFLGERKNGDNTVHKNPGKSKIGFYQGEITLKKGTNTYQVEIPRHEAHYPHSQKLAPFYPEVMPFRYAEIVTDNELVITDLKQLALFYYFDDKASSFQTSDTNLKKVWDLCKYTLKATPFLGIYCDGNRERMPYEADAYIQQLGHYSVDREFAVARYTLAFLVSHASWPTEWQMNTVMMAREHLMYTGDTELLSSVYNDLIRKTLIDLEDERGLISTRTGKVTPEFLKSIHYEGNGFRDIVDWPAGTPGGQTQAQNAGASVEGERDGYEFTDYNTVVNAYHYYALKCMAEIARAIGKTDDAKLFFRKAEQARKSIMELMFDNDRGYFKDGIGSSHSSIHANMFPLAFNIVPQDKILTVAEFVKSRGMACSVYGAQYLMEALYNAGEADYALKLMTSESKRSWMNMINAGSTMTTEAWDEIYKPNLTWNHAWGSAPANIIPRKMFGIQPVEPGFGRFVINPQPSSLEKISISMPTIRGTIGCELIQSKNKWSMLISVPGNTEALLFVPAELPVININGIPGKPDSEIAYLGMTRNVIKLQPGNFRITVSK